MENIWRLLPEKRNLQSLKPPICSHPARRKPCCWGQIKRRVRHVITWTNVILFPSSGAEPNPVLTRIQHWDQARAAQGPTHKEPVETSRHFLEMKCSSRKIEIGGSDRLRTVRTYRSRGSCHTHRQQPLTSLLCVQKKKKIIAKFRQRLSSRGSVWVDRHARQNSLKGNPGSQICAREWIFLILGDTVTNEKTCTVQEENTTPSTCTRSFRSFRLALALSWVRLLAHSVASRRVLASPQQLHFWGNFQVAMAMLTWQASEDPRLEPFWPRSIISVKFVRVRSGWMWNILSPYFSKLGLLFLKHTRASWIPIEKGKSSKIVVINSTSKSRQTNLCFCGPEWVASQSSTMLWCIGGKFLHWLLEDMSI